MFSGAVTLLVWGVPVVAAAVGGDPTVRLDSYATDRTYALDLGVITPAAVTAGTMILRRIPAGYVLALPLMVLEASLAPLLAAQTVSQLAAGVVFTPAEVAGPITGFVVIAGVAGWLLVVLLRSLSRNPLDDRAVQPLP